MSTDLASDLLIAINPVSDDEPAPVCLVHTGQIRSHTPDACGVFAEYALSLWNTEGGYVASADYPVCARHIPDAMRAITAHASAENATL